ncbi:DUF262 domain-containing protein [Desulfallas thermosapovorans]|uniref:Uncharacterized protein with ParB-like and HNH nuclease domain n=1 Tax=Desulfallas thermosapovorans DSM 6562 TaxID=1121431 RepID=A0A5S4ZMS9_9FIRM|nr:DUF262 domain-containing protein [Desulfallas thermosapovorans]TYO93234.1 uncharacterized protein with ParB-like and HNH nuclease domain [Desulfallas thermosapovorans DSM 6562]
MSADIEGKQFPLKEVFSDWFAFSIPYYQRPYAWTTEQAGELFDDLVAALGESDEPVRELDPYFLGSIVLIKGKDPEAQVVDGQQRLITFTILLSVLRELTADTKVAGDLERFLVEKGSSLLDTPDRYRLTVRARDQYFFEKYIQSRGGIEELKQLNGSLTDSQINFRDNALLFRSRLQELPEAKRQRLAQYVLHRCFLVVVWTPDIDSAYRIFSVLNDRGMDLSHADILKAEIIGQIPEGQQAEYARKWEEAEEQLGREAFKDLFAYIRMIYRKTKPRATVLKEFREAVCATEEPRQLVDRVLLPMADAYNDILYANYSSPALAGEVNRYLGWLGRIDNTDWIPPAILFLVRNNNQPEKLVHFFRDLERLAAGMMITRTYINQRIDRYGALLKAIEAGEDLYTDTSPLQLTAEERRLVIEALDGDIYRQVKVRLLVLLRLDAALSSGEAVYNYRVISVEHVLPQNPPQGSKWLEWFPAEGDRDQWTHRLGNLVLLSRSKNSQARNFEFERKKNEYFARKGTSPFALTTQVLMEEEWTQDVVKQRQQKLLDTLKQVWRL